VSEVQEIEKTLVLLDAHALIHRSYHAIPRLTHRGMQLNAVYGFAATLLHIVRTLDPEYLAVCFDEKGPTFRDADYAEYKAHRPPTPDELKSQFPLCRQLVDEFGIPLFALAGYEADDLIGTLAEQAKTLGTPTLIVTGDHDSYQLVDDYVKIYNVSRGIQKAEIVDADSVRARYGFGPEHIVDYKALRGDTSDNIPGVPGIGEVTAKKLITQFGTVEALYEALEIDFETPVAGVPEKLRVKLLEHMDKAFLSKKLATIERHAPISLDLAACRIKAYNEDGARALFKEWNFRSLAVKLPTAEPTLIDDSQQAMFS
jgi:DNA polymerase-1